MSRQPYLHLVYPRGPRIATPWAIGRKLTEHLSSRFTVVQHDLDADYHIDPQPGDILLGHSASAPWTVFRRSVVRPGWKRKLLLQPFAPGDSRHGFWLPGVVRHCDLFLAITGRHWMEALPRTHMAHLAPKIVHLDLAVDRSDFPRVKTRWNPPGRRRFLYIGNWPWYKNLGFLNDLAGRFPQCDFSWFGPVPKRSGRFPHLRQLGVRDFSQVEARAEIATFDFMITLGSADANPTTILESMAWGLLPVCTPESGYSGYRGIPNIPLDDLDAGVAMIERLQSCAEADLDAMRYDNDAQLDGHFTWSRFCRQIDDAIDSTASPALLPEGVSNRIARCWWAQRSPYRWWRVSILRKRLMKSWFGTRS